MSRSEHFNSLTNRILPIVVLAYQGLALMAFLVLPFLAYRWMQTPFLGAFVEQTMVFNGVGQETPPDAWQLYLDKPLRLNYQIVEVNGKDVYNSTDIQNALKYGNVGQQVPVLVRRISDGAEETRVVTLQSFPVRARTMYFFVPFAVGLIFLAISLWIFGMRRTESTGRAFAVFATSVAIGSAGLFDLYTTHGLSWLWTFAIACAGGSLIDLGLVFPQEVSWIKNRPYLRWIGYGIGLVLFLWAAVNLYNFKDPKAYILNWRWIYILAALSVFFFVGMVLYRRITSRSPVVRLQARTVLWGMIFAFGPLAIWFLITAFHPMNFQPLLLLPAVIFPLSTGYTILRFRLLRTDFLLRRGALYALLTILALGGYALLVSGLTLIFGQAFQVTNPLFVGVIVFLFALVLNPLRNRLQHLVDVAFFRGVRAYEQRVRDFSHDLTNTVDLAVIIRTLRQHIVDSLLPERLHI